MLPRGVYGLTTRRQERSMAQSGGCGGRAEHSPRTPQDSSGCPRIPARTMYPEQGVAMNSSLISKIEKARKYAEERDERLRFESFRVHIQGDNSRHVVELTNGVFSCDCDFFVGWSSCSHVMAIERVLGGTIPEPPSPERR